MALDLNSETIFVGGYLFSGTSIMQGFLCKAPETNELTREVHYLRGLMEAYATGLERFETNTYDFFGNRDNFLSFNRDIIKRYLKANEDRFGDKRLVFRGNMVTNCFPEVADLMPGAKFVIMTRDIRDVIANRAEDAKARNKTYSRNQVNKDLGECRNMYMRLKDQADSFKNRTIYVSFESLVKNSQEELDRVTDFLGLSSIDAKAWISGGYSEEISASEYELKVPREEFIGRCFRVLDASLLAELERVGAQMAQDLGIDCLRKDINFKK